MRYSVASFSLILANIIITGLDVYVYLSIQTVQNKRIFIRHADRQRISPVDLPRHARPRRRVALGVL